MPNKAITTDLLNQDPEAFEYYFKLTEKDSRDYQQRVQKIESFWRDWPRKRTVKKD